MVIGKGNATMEKRRGLSKWKDIFPVLAYKMFRAGMSEVQVAKEIGVTRTTYAAWEREHPHLREAKELARKERADGDTLPRWIYQQLAPELRKLWDSIKKWEDEDNGVAKIELMLADHGVRVRQQLFLYALCNEQFSASAACSKVNVTKSEMDKWVEEDIRFAELVREIEWHKRNFFEAKLVELAEDGNVQAILFANRTLNASRGYGHRADVNVHVDGSVTHGVLDLAELMPLLSENAKTEILAAIRCREAQAQGKPKEVTITDVIVEEIRKLPPE